MTFTARPFRACRDIRAGEIVTMDDFEQAPLGATVIEVPNDCGIDAAVVVTPDLSLEEAAQAMRQLSSPTSVTMPLEIAEDVKTFDDFFGEKMAGSIANQLAEQLYGIDCMRCGTPTKKPVEVGARKLCAECAALEY